MSTAEMTGRVCVVTGANSGIGKATAKGLARMGATVVLVSRSLGKGQAALNEISKETGNKSLSVQVVDLSSLDSVRRLASSFLEGHDSLHVLVNNAGTYLTKRHATVDGLETTFVVNYLSRFLLTNLLLDTLKKSSPARIIDVAGAYHRKGTINFEDLQGAKDYSGAVANNQAKLANVLFTYELARRLEGTRVTSNCLHPGTIATPLLEKDKDLPSSTRFMYKLFKVFARSPEKGAETILDLATSPDVENSTGMYFEKKRPVRSSAASYDIPLGRRLWEVSTDLTGLG